ncbi:MAG: ankyrin repeat domain-containing protein [SAR324 cluster bacterium]|nr:ankyrin repeat domain-containing protein [SAR324 cluster bacterium]
MQSSWFQQIQSGDISAIAQSLKQGQDVNAIDHRGMTALMIAANDGKYPVAEKLIHAGAKIDFQGYLGWNALMLAVFHGHMDIVRLLLSKNANLNLQRLDGRTALILAVCQGHQGFVELLLRQGASTEIADKRFSRTAWEWALHEKKLEIASLFQPTQAPTSGEASVQEQPQAEPVKQKILLVEDSPFQARMLIRMLEHSRYEVLLAERLQDALQLLTDTHFIMILLDLHLPDSSGIDTFYHIKKQARLIPVVVLTGTDDEILGERLIQQGAQHYLVKKNTDESLLLRTIHYAIARQTLQNELEQHRRELENKVEERTAELQKVLAQLQQQHVALEQSNKKTMDSIRYATRIQRSILPDIERIRASLPDCFVIWMPRDIVGGDFFVTHFMGDQFLIAVVDCTGHGVPGAFITMMASTALRRIILYENCESPGEILRKLNVTIKKALHQDHHESMSDDGLDIGICWVKPDQKCLVYAGANLPLFYTDGAGIRSIPGDRESVGYKRSDLSFNFTDNTLSLTSGMKCYMATDGLMDQLGGNKGFPWGKKRFMESLRNGLSLPVDEQKEQVLANFHTYKNTYDQIDDITLVGFDPASFVRRHDGGFA